MDLPFSDRDSIILYLNTLGSQYPLMKQWNIHPWKSILAMVRNGNLTAIQSIEYICKCITPSGWQDLAEIATRYRRLDIIEWIGSYAPIEINWTTIASIARDKGDMETASYADGFPYLLEDLAVTDYEPWPLDLGPEGDPMADKGKWIFDWRMENYKEDMVPEESLPIGEGEDDNPLAPIPYPLGQTGYGFQDYTLQEELPYDNDDDKESLDVAPDDEI